MKNKQLYNKIYTKIDNKKTDLAPMKDMTKEKRALMKILENITQNLEFYINSSLKRRMISIHIENIRKAIDFYFNPETKRNSIYIDKNFKNGLKEIYKYTRYMPNNYKSEKIKENVYQDIHTLISLIDTQINQIIEIEEEKYQQNKGNIIQHIF